MKTLLTLALVLGMAYVSIVLVYALMQRNLIYYPANLPPDQARELATAQGGAPWLDADGRWLGWKVESGPAASNTDTRRAIVFHGNAGMALHRGYYADLLTGFTESGPWTVHLFEYPGYGPREGHPDEATLVDAAVDAVDALLAQDPEPLLIVGESLGGGVASALTRRRPDAVAALLLIAPFDSMVNVARHHMPWLPAGLLLRDRYDNREALRSFGKPLVVITAGNDEIVPAVLAEPLLRQHGGPSLHETQDGAGHNTLHFDARRPPWPAVDRFLSTASYRALHRDPLPGAILRP